MTFPDPPPENKPRFMVSQFSLEIAVVLILILMVLVSLWALFWPNIQMRMDQISQADGSPTPIVPQYEVVEEGTYAEIVGTEVVAFDNCDQDEVITETITLTRTIEHRILVEGDLPSALAGPLMNSLESFYGFEHGEVEEETIEIPLVADPEIHAEQTVSWQYIWKEGEVKVIRRDGTESSYPYRARVQTDWEPVSEKSEPAICTPEPDS